MYSERKATQVLLQMILWIIKPEWYMKIFDDGSESTKKRLHYFSLGSSSDFSSGPDVSAIFPNCQDQIKNGYFFMYSGKYGS